MARPGVVVRSDELLDAVWPGVAVTPQALTNVIRELRLALADPARTSRWLQSVYGTGYRFLAEGGGAKRPPGTHASVLVGRERQQRRLREAWEAAVAGTSQVVLVEGEPGIGKTALVDAFVTEVAAVPGQRALVAPGACIEHHGPGEPYLPLLSALERLSGGAAAPRLRALLRRTAPTWLLQMPSLAPAGERTRLARLLLGATAARMLREGVAWLQALAADRPLVLVLEDLHWADLATLDLVVHLARRPIAGPLLLLATYRHADAVAGAHPVAALGRELAAERRAIAVALPSLERRAVARYLEARLGGRVVPALVTLMEARSAGNPLFLGSLVGELVERGGLVRHAGAWRLAPGVDGARVAWPATLRDFVRRELERLPPRERAVVEAAAVAGVEFGADEVARALGRPLAVVADACVRLARVGRLLRAADGRAAFAFVHAAHRRIVDDALADTRRRELHRRLAANLERSEPSSARAFAARLATHFVRGGAPSRAAAWYERAAADAERRFAYREAGAYVRAAAAQLDRTGSPAARRERAAGVQLRLGSLLVLADGYSSPEVHTAFTRARRLFRGQRSVRGTFMAEMGLAMYELTRARHRRARVHADRLVALTQSGLATLRPIAGCWAGFVSSARGELGRARAELEAAAAATPEPGLPLFFDVGRMIQSQLALVLTLIGEVAGGRRLAERALARSRVRGTPADLTHAALLAAERGVLARDAVAGRAPAALAMALAERNGLPSFLALARFYAAALAPERPARRLAKMQAALAERARLGDRWHEPMLQTHVAEAALATGDLRTARRALATAAARAAVSGEGYWLAEIERVRARTMTRGGRRAQAAAARVLERAAARARRQGAHLLALRARNDLAELAIARALS